VHESIEHLAEANRLHPKVIRQALRLAFLSPELTSAILEGRQPASLSLTRIPAASPFRAKLKSPMSRGFEGMRRAYTEPGCQRTRN
jgi:hypothetical protein